MEYIYSPAIDKLNEPVDEAFWAKCNEESRKYVLQYYLQLFFFYKFKKLLVNFL